MIYGSNRRWDTEDGWQGIINKPHSDVPKSEYDCLRGVSKGSLTTRVRLDHQNLQNRALYFQSGKRCFHSLLCHMEL
jgi:hypothetical protein